MADFDFALAEIDTKALASEGVQMPLKRLDGEPLLNAKKEPIGLIMLGSDSEDYRTSNQRITRNRIKRARDKKVKEEQALDAARADDIELLADMTIGWYGILDKSGKELPFAREGAIKLFTDYPVARDQADLFIADRTNFTKASSDA